ncbi:MAG: ABC transporter permease [Gemmatimonadota bacterium]|jgi:putative ABC transport system permease protein
MRFLSKWLFRIRATLFPGRLEDAMREEMAFHMDMEARKLMAEGMTPEEALRRARRDFGEPEYHKEKARESWGIGMVQNFRIDARHTLRALRRNPVFAFVSILTLGLGIGANTAIFSVVNGILFRDLPFPESHRLVSLCETFPDEPGRCSTASTPNVADWAERSRSFDGIGVFRWWGHILEAPEGAQNLSSLIATPEFFDVVGYQPAVGRVLLPEDQLEGNRNRAVLDYDFWQARFGGDENIIGSTLVLSGETVEVIGVLQEGQKPPTLSGEPEADIWLPLHFDPRDNERRDWRGFYAIGRLGINVSLEQARQELGAIQQGLMREYPEANQGWGLQLTTLHERVVGGVQSTLLLFMGAVGLVLLITCANIANLILARLSSREAELGIRTALGAGTGRLTGQLLTEGLILALLGGGLGLVIAWIATPLFLSLAPAGIPRLAEVAMDGQVLAFTLGLAVLATVLFGIAPVARASRIRPMDSLRQSRHGKRRGVVGGLNGILVIAEVTLALALLVGAGLLTRSFVAFNQWDPGIDREHLVVFSTFAATSAYQNNDAVMNLYRTLDQELMALPGVRSVARTSAGPLFGGFESDQVLRAEDAGSVGTGLPARWFDVSPAFFETLGLPILRGRGLTRQDNAEAPMVMVVNQTLADHLWPGEDPIGQEVWMELHDGSRQVVGVVADIPPLDPDAPVDAEMYWPQAQYTRPFSFFVVRTEGDPGPIMRQVADRVHSVDPDIQVGAVNDYDALLGQRLVQPRFNMLLIAIFSGVALVLAGIGIYGVVSRSVASRTREIGLRIALGAGQGLVVRQVVGQSVALAAAGVALGLGLALVLSRFIRGFLHGVAPNDPLTYATVAMGLFGVAVLASLVPALTASRIDPMESLREE